MVTPRAHDERDPIGQAWLRREFRLATPPPAVEHYFVASARRTVHDGSRTIELHPRRSVAVDATPVSHLRFALRREAIDLGVLVAALRAIGPGALEGWMRKEPTSGVGRRAWFFYETFVGRTLDVDDVRDGNYLPALDPDRHLVAAGRRSQRHRVMDNLLGGRCLCPTVRRTPRLARSFASNLDAEARALAASHDPRVLARAIDYLFTKETRSSYAIEGEIPSATRTERFIAALRTALDFDPYDKAHLIALQGDIVDPRFAEQDWRRVQNFVGETAGPAGGYRERVHFICPRPADVPGLMTGWMAMARRVSGDEIDPIVAAAVTAFAFVFVHPFEDGNGRIHRFVIHHVLARRGFGPPGVIFPVSAAIMRDRAAYDRVLETFSRPLTPLIKWRWTDERALVVENETSDLYRYFDATAFAEYLYERVAETISRDLKEELGFVSVFDRALDRVREIVDMPDRRAQLFVVLCMESQGRLASDKRRLFPELTDDEITRMASAVQAAMADDERPPSVE
jgi:Fic family protein